MMELIPIDRRNGLTRESFKSEYLDKQKAVVFTDLIKDWPATSKWTIEYFKEKYGDLLVPVYSPTSSEGGKGYMNPDNKIPFREYLEMLEAGPTQYRMFLFNLLKHAPELRGDFMIPTIMDGFFDSLPFMFFGGESSYVALHYDIDLSHVFLNQLYGRKRVVLFKPEDSRKLYHHPFTVASYVDVNNPDYDKYPALRGIQGYECILHPGDTIFMPAGHWHYIEYMDGGYSISLRANESLTRRVAGFFNIARHYVVDRSLNRLLGKRWKDIKENIAQRRAEELIK